MKIHLGTTDAEISAARRTAYLKAWPLEAQMEAHAEAAGGRPEKLRQMLADFDTIRTKHPKK